MCSGYDLITGVGAFDVMNWQGDEVLRLVLTDCVRIGDEVSLMDDVLDLVSGTCGDVCFGDVYHYVLGRYGILSLDHVGSIYFEMGEFSRVRNGIWVVLGDFDSLTGDLDVFRLEKRLVEWREELLDIRENYLDRMGLTMEDVVDFYRSGYTVSGYRVY